MAPQKQLECPRITGRGDLCSQVAPPTSKVVAGGTQYAPSSTITPTEACSADLYRCIKRRVGCSLKLTHCKVNLVPSRKQVAHKLPGTKGRLPGPRVPRALLEQHSSRRYRQHHSGCLHKQGEGDEVGPFVCPSVENPDLVLKKTGYSQSLTHSTPTECGSIQAVQDRSDHSEWSLLPEVFQSISVLNRWHQPQIDLFAMRFNNTLTQFVSPVPACHGRILTHKPSHQ